MVSAADLALATWDLPEYHPLRDGNRLRVAVRRLRERLGADRIETIGDGYRRLGTARILEDVGQRAGDGTRNAADPCGSAALLTSGSSRT